MIRGDSFKLESFGNWIEVYLDTKLVLSLDQYKNRDIDDMWIN